MVKKKIKKNILKILIINTLYTPNRVGGAEVSVQQLAEQYVKEQHVVTVVSLGKENKEYKVNGVKVFQLKIENIYWAFEERNRPALQKLRWHLRDINNKRYNQKLYDIINQVKPDVLHTNNIGGFSSQIWQISKSKNIPVVHTLRDYYLLNTNTTLYKDSENVEYVDLFSKFRSVFLREMSNKVDAVVGISQSVLERHLKFNFFDNVDRRLCIYNGFHVQQKDVVDNENAIGFIGQVKEHKGVIVLLEAYKQISEPKPKLIIAGKASRELIDAYAREKSIEFLGFVDKEAFFDRIKYLIVPSIWHEPFGRVVLEGVLRGKIVLGSNRGAIPELLRGNPFYIFSPTVRNLRNKLNEIINNTIDVPEFIYDERNINEFSIEESAFKYLELYKQIQK